MFTKLMLDFKLYDKINMENYNIDNIKFNIK